VIDRNLVRIALFELFWRRDVPVPVAINEAVELAKTFGHESAPKFVNGVLGSIARARTDTSGQPGAEASGERRDEARREAAAED
jgi:N utilization substance protein B